MPLRKISEPSRRERCLSPEHNPPNMIVLQPGTYEHTCPSCGHATVFTIPLIICSAPPVRETYFPGYNIDDTVRWPGKINSDENNKWYKSITTYI
jgi:hypothetical protein